MPRDRAPTALRGARRLAGPLAVAAAAVVGAAAVLAVDPGQGGLIICPWRALTGLDCPFCGATRATAALLRGDLLAALDHNLFYVLVVVPLLLVAWVTWTTRRVRARPFPDLQRRTWQLLMGATIAWWAIRLVVPWLGSGLST